jgi:hypothetical protein
LFVVPGMYAWLRTAKPKNFDEEIDNAYNEQGDEQQGAQGAQHGGEPQPA